MAEPNLLQLVLRELRRSTGAPHGDRSKLKEDIQSGRYRRALDHLGSMDTADRNAVAEVVREYLHLMLARRHWEHVRGFEPSPRRRD